jgi:hypothetical protein
MYSVQSNPTLQKKVPALKSELPEFCCHRPLITPD